MPKEPKRKVGRKGSSNGFLWIGGLFLLGLAALWGWSEWSKPERELPGLETYAAEGNQHVDPTTVVAYKTDPPTSGAHSSVETEPGFYVDPQPKGELVHALEHGHIVIYYNPKGTPADVVESLKTYARKYTGHWDGVVVAPREQEEAVVLTAWRRILRLKTWDQSVAETFIDAFRGRGPENPVR